MNTFNEIVNVPFKVLDDGFVRVVDYMGSDDSIVQAARISYGKGTKRIHEDRGLIRYLMRHSHTTPFEMCEIKLHIRAPMDTWRQWIRHRTANVNEYSTRYSEAINAMQETPPDGWRRQSFGNKQGSEGLIDVETGRNLSQKEKELHELSRHVYLERLQLGVAKEQARKDLPLSTYTEAYWKIDLHNLLHFLNLRMDDKAQFEIRSYANVIGHQIVSRWCPLTWEAFSDYQLQSTKLTRFEVLIIQEIVANRFEEATMLAINFQLLPGNKDLKKRNREREELEEKLTKLGLIIPWNIG